VELDIEGMSVHIDGLTHRDLANIQGRLRELLELPEKEVKNREAIDRAFASCDTYE